MSTMQLAGKSTTQLDYLMQQIWGTVPHDEIAEGLRLALILSATDMGQLLGYAGRDLDVFVVRVIRNFVGTGVGREEEE